MSGNMTLMYGSPPGLSVPEDWKRPMVAPTAPAPPDAARIQAFIEADPELKALAEVIAILSGVESGARSRIADFIAGKWGTKR